MIRVLVQQDAIDVPAELDLHDAGGHGASASFIGRVRGDDDLTELFLEHHPVLTASGLTDLAHAAMDRWHLAALTLIHRVGAMIPGETIVLVLASSPHRTEALAANEFLLMGFDAKFQFRPTYGSGAQSAELILVEEGYYDKGNWVRKRLWNGDEVYHSTLVPEGVILKIKLRPAGKAFSGEMKANFE